MKLDVDLEVIKLEGSPYEIGYQQGRKLREKPVSTLTSAVAGNEIEAWCAQIDPILLEELTGLADGLGMDIPAVLTAYSGYGAAMPAMGCTAHAHKNVYARNYDFSPDMYDARFVFVKPNQGYASMGFSQHVVGRLDGMNEAGLVAGLHFVNTGSNIHGFMATTIIRMLLNQCGTIAEAMELLHHVPHRHCYNYSLLDYQGNMVIVEATPDNVVVRDCPELLTCTNHFETEHLKRFNRDGMVEHGRKRGAFIWSQSSNNLSPMAAYDMFHSQASPLFFTDYKGFFGTLHTVVYVPSEGKAITGLCGQDQPHIWRMEKSRNI